mgnify:CR=1 FL=1
MGIVFKNNAKTTLGSSLTNSATSATVTDGSVFPSLAAGEFFFCTFDDGTNNEIVKVTARSSNTLTIVRAQESTTARAFSSGDAAELRLTAGVLETIQENIAAKSANQTVFNATTSGGATSYDIGIDPGVEANAMVFLDGVMQHHDTFSFSSNTLTFDAAPVNGTKLEVIVDNLINLQSSNLTVDSFTAADVSGSPQTDFTLSDTPAAETNLIVFVDGVFQDQDAYTISNNTLTITTGVIAGRGVTVYVINPVNIGTPSDGTITSAKLSGNITMPGTLTVGSNDVAFDSPTFVVDNSNSRVGLGTASPSVPVDIVGDVKMSANLTVDTSTLVVDSTNNRVGIGEASPTRELVVKNSSDHSIIAAVSGTSNLAGMVMGDTDDDDIGHILYNNSSNSMSFRTNTSDAVTIDSSGRVGIGTTSPSSLLHLGGANNKGIEITSGTSNAGYLAVYQDQAIFSINRDGADGSFADTGKAAAVIKMHSANADSKIELQTTTSNNAEPTTRMTILKSGNVGIGETSPQDYLEIDGSGSGLGGLTISNSTHSHAALSFARSSTATARIFTTEPDATHTGQLNFQTSNASGGSPNLVTGMVIDENQNVGIGTSSPGHKLSFGDFIPTDGKTITVYENGNIASGIGVVSGVYRNFTNETSALSFGHYAHSDGTTYTERMRIHNNGAVTKPTNCYFLAVRSTNISNYNFSVTSGATTTIFTDIVTAQTSALGQSSFSTTDGTFSAPVDGLYLFHVSFYSNVTIEQAWLTSNGARINYTDMVCNGSTGGQVFTGTVQYYMTAGASIRVHPYSAGSTSDYVYDNVYHTYWKGVLLG